jgi:TolB-like protein
LPEEPSVAVLPFENNSGDADQAYFADGITENIITGLTRFRDLFVIGLKSSLATRDRVIEFNEIGRQLGVAHLVEGSVRKAGNRVRVTAQLVDAATSHRLWAEHYDRELDDIFAVQDEITNVIVARLAGHIEGANRLRAGQKPAHDMAAYDHLLRARHCMRHYTEQGELAARSHLGRALELDSGYAAAFATLALSHVHEYEATWCRSPQAAIDRAYELAHESVALDDCDSLGHRALAYAAHYRGQHELAEKEIERAIAMNPNDYSNLCIKSWVLLFSGRPDGALVCLKESLRLNPFAPDNCFLSIGLAEYTARRYRDSAEKFGQMTSWDTLRLACLAACHGQLGEDAEARAAAADWLKAVGAAFGDDAIARWRTYMNCLFRFQKSDDREHLLDGLRKARLPV